MSNVSYDEVCKMVGHLYISSQTTIKSNEEQYQKLLLAYQQTQKALTAAQANNDVKENVDGIPPEGKIS